MGSVAQALGLYISVPFCRAKCSFCNFASGVGTADAVDRYVQLLCGEMRAARRAAAAAGLSLPEIVDSVYFGGGTPSLLTPRQIEQVFAVVREEFSLQPAAEVTLEAAPGQIDDKVLEAALACGVNRVSLGVQSFVDREAQAVGRSHTERSCRAELERLHSAGCSHVGADLIAGLPYQTETSWQHSLDVATSAGWEHLSVYMFEVDAESRLGREVLGGGARLHAPAVPSDDLVAALYEQACERLPAAGFPQYEISNFAKDSTRSQHNLKYWLREPYLGFGLDAHSMLASPEGDVWRWANADELTAYDGAPRMNLAERASQREIFEEIVFLGLRLNEGLTWRSLERFPESWTEELRQAAAMLAEHDLLMLEGERLRLTARGRLLSSEVFGELLVPAWV